VPRLDRLEHSTTGRAERRMVGEAGLDIVEAAQRPEVVGLVVVEGSLLAEPPERRVGVGVDRLVVRVVVDVAPRRHGHPSPFAGRNVTGASERSLTMSYETPSGYRV